MKQRSISDWIEILYWRLQSRIIMMIEWSLAYILHFIAIAIDTSRNIVLATSKLTQCSVYSVVDIGVCLYQNVYVLLSLSTMHDFDKWLYRHLWCLAVVVPIRAAAAASAATLPCCHCIWPTGWVPGPQDLFDSTTNSKVSVWLSVFCVSETQFYGWHIKVLLWKWLRTISN